MAEPKITGLAYQKIWYGQAVNLGGHPYYLGESRWERLIRWLTRRKPKAYPITSEPENQIIGVAVDEHTILIK